MLNDDQTHTIKTQTTTAPPIFVEPDALPPMPQVVPMPQMQPPVVNSGSAAPSDDIVMAPIVTTTTPKKKFAGGKIIATILGLFLLVGGVGAGVYLTGQNQNVNEKAGQTCTPPDNCESCGSPSRRQACRLITIGVNGSLDSPVLTRCQLLFFCKDTSCRQEWEGECEEDIIPTPNTTAVVPVCQSATISKNTLTGPGDSLTITSTATTSDITGFSYGFYNLDNLYGPSNPKPIWFTNNTDYVVGKTTSAKSSNTLTVTYDELNKNDLNWGNGQQKPTHIQVNAFFGNSAEWNHSDAKCVVQFNVSVVQTTTLSCIDLTSSVANPVVGQSVTATCYGRFSSTTTSPVAQFGVNLNGTLLGVSGAIPLVAGEARYTTTVPQEGNYLVQCQICTDATLSNCTTMGQAN